MSQIANQKSDFRNKKKSETKLRIQESGVKNRKSFKTNQKPKTRN